ncbi:hypothetical protein KC332_g15684 [Hortaea werneckii]|nr:hypothetical protein KC358_g15715 [Hortaea werneckii]KAI6802765.1 hypothetical protein KC350_g15370 [Hortaea werneckii]KAI6903598.1 hypothetical protein KC348_g15628 [Hortaea werneckii]KAI6922230.1 hypothetical protein KC341_g15505 [Hortaea werneckii]KAI6955532.1 hypothetical protein KC321_g15705 [Hortaea werneckii]
MSVRDQVLAINELLEVVLLQLPMENFFLAQQVCKRWRLLITTSDSIQKALSMRPCTKAADAAVDAIRCTYTQSDGTKVQVATNPNLCEEDTSRSSPSWPAYLLFPLFLHSSSSSTPSNSLNSSGPSNPSSSATSPSTSPLLPSPQPRYFAFHDSAIYSRNRNWLHPDTMYVTHPPIPLTFSISY